MDNSLSAKIRESVSLTEQIKEVARAEESQRQRLADLISRRQEPRTRSPRSDRRRGQQAATRSSGRWQVTSEEPMTPCKCQECACSKFAEPWSKRHLCYDCENDDHEDDE